MLWKIPTWTSFPGILAQWIVCLEHFHFRQKKIKKCHFIPRPFTAPEEWGAGVTADMAEDVTRPGLPSQPPTRPPALPSFVPWFFHFLAFNLLSFFSLSFFLSFFLFLLVQHVYIFVIWYGVFSIQPVSNSRRATCLCLLDDRRKGVYHSNPALCFVCCSIKFLYM